MRFRANSRNLTRSRARGPEGWLAPAVFLGELIGRGQATLPDREPEDHFEDPMLQRTRMTLIRRICAYTTSSLGKISVCRIGPQADRHRSREQSTDACAIAT
jgi:hypothetical protein